MFDHLKSLIQAGSAALASEPAVAPSKPQVKVILVPEAAVSVSTAPTPANDVTSGPSTIIYTEEVSRSVVAAAAPAPITPAPAASGVSVSAEPTVVSFVPEVIAPKGTQLFDSSNQLRGTLMPDGKFIAVDVEADPLASLSAEDRAEINWDDEKRVDLPQRSAGRIRFLLTQETEQQTRDRIANDIHRALFARPRNEFDPDKTPAAESIKKWIQ